MKKALRFVCAVLVLVMLFTCACCSRPGTADNTIRLYCTEGFAQLGIQKLLKDHSQTYDNTVCSEQKVYDAVVDGDADIALCSLATAVKLYDETDSSVRIAAACASQNLYVLAANFEDDPELSAFDGRKVYISGEGDTQHILNYIFLSNSIANVSLNIPGGYDEQAVLKAASEDEGICVLSEPHASYLEQSNSRFSSVMCLNDEWKKICNTGNTPVTCCAVVSSDFAKNNEAALSNFLSHYQISLNYLYYANSSTAINELTADGFFATVDYASSAIKRSGVGFLSGEEMQFAVAATLEALSDKQMYAGVPVPDSGIFLH